MTKKLTMFSNIDISSQKLNLTTKFKQPKLWIYLSNIAKNRTGLNDMKKWSKNDNFCIDPIMPFSAFKMFLICQTIWLFSWSNLALWCTS